jgi:ATP-dependent Clp protease ATP-binding subunit ClpC
VGVTRPAATASGLARMEARRLGHHYLGPEHLLLGLLLQGDNPAARVLPPTASTRRPPGSRSTG